MTDRRQFDGRTDGLTLQRSRALALHPRTHNLVYRLVLRIRFAFDSAVADFTTAILSRDQAPHDDACAADVR